MSISTIQSNIRRSKTKITDLRKKLYKEKETENKARKDILQAKKAVTRTSSQTTIKSNLSKLDRLNKTLEKTSKEQATLNKKIFDEEKTLHRYEEQLIREEAKELKRQISVQSQRDLDHELTQQKLLEELFSYKQAIKAHTEELSGQATEEEQFDVFISHASEDKEGFVGPLAALLKESDVDVWYDEYKLTWGKPTRRSIDKGLANCRFGIVVFSENFFRKNWTNYELDGLVGRNMSEKEDLILPIWHNVEYEDVKKFSPPLADLTALKSNSLTIEEIADQLIALLTDSSSDELEL